VRLIAQLARTAGHTVAYTTTDGVYRDDELVEAGDYSGFSGAAKALAQPGIDLAVLETARARGFSRIAILGVSDLAEIAAICALDTGITIAGVVDPDSDLPRFVGVPVAKVFDDVEGSVDAVLVTDSRTTRATTAAAVARFGADRVLIPQLLARAFAKRGDVS